MLKKHGLSVVRAFSPHAPLRRHVAPQREQVIDLFYALLAARGAAHAIPNASERVQLRDRPRGPAGQSIGVPPVTLSVWPVIHAASSDAKNATAFAMSLGRPWRPSKIERTTACFIALASA